MNDNYSTYRIWAPDNALWTQWAKPVLFSQAMHGSPQELTIPGVKWAPYSGRQNCSVCGSAGKKKRTGRACPGTDGLPSRAAL